jgi:hypothetical protein
MAIKINNTTVIDDSLNLTNIANISSSNVANSVVIRDASGNFNAGSITAALLGNATTATTLQTARTIGGVSFNGSANINLPGVNIAGNQSTSGNAATASNIITTTPNIGFSASGQDIQFSTQGGPQVQGQGGGAAMMSFHRPGSYGINFGLGNDNQLRTGGWSRGGNHVVLDSGNYNTYAPTKTGGGASGTWGINITGNAATANSASSATNATNVVGGNVACNAITVTSGAPTIWMYDTDQADFAMHVNSSLWYILNQGGSGIMYVDQSGNFTAAGNVTAYSDARLKTNVATLENALQKVKSIRGVSFEKDGKNSIGVIAQELQETVPEVVQENADGYLSVAYGNLVGLLIEAIKDLSNELEEVKTKIQG